MSDRRRIRVAVVFGGRSAEHAISCVSAGSVLAALDPVRYDVLPVGITRDGRWVLPPPGQPLAIDGGWLPEVTGGSALALPTSAGIMVLEPGEIPRALDAVDVAFPLLHGPYGEDGTIQGLFELAGIPYVGSGVFASAAAMDKAHMKTLLAAAGLPIGRYAVLRAGGDPGTAAAAVESLGLPVFVKPARGGSSIGIGRVDDLAELPAAIAAAGKHDPKVLVEAALTGLEVECGVLGGLGGGPPEPSLPGEVHVDPAYPFYDFTAKYVTDATSFDIPADLPAGATGRVRAMAVAAFAALDCEGLARVDFFVDPAGLRAGGRGADGGVTVNEVNTMPGFTPMSMFPRMWAASGLDFAALCDRLVRLALERGTGLR